MKSGLRLGLLLGMLTFPLFSWFEQDVYSYFIPFHVDYTPTVGTAPLTVTFTQMGNEGLVLCEASGITMTWDFGDGSNEQATSFVDQIPLPVVQHTYTKPGVYMPSFSRTGEDGCGGPLTTDDSFPGFGPPSLTVNAPPCSTAPTTTIQNVLPGTTVGVGSSILLTGRATNPSGCQSLTTRWQLNARPQGSNAALSTSSGLTSTFVADRPGSYSISFGAANEFGAANTTIAITASDGEIPAPTPTPAPSASQFLNTPGISAINPSSGISGLLVVLVGTNFSPILEENRVFFGRFQAQVISASATTLTVIVPDLSEGVYSVTVSIFESSLSPATPGMTERSFTTAQGSDEGSGPVQADSEGSNIVLFEVDDRAGKRPLSLPDVEQGFVIGDLLIFFRTPLSLQQLTNFQNDFGFESLVSYPSLGFFRGVLERQTVGETLRLLELLNQDPRVDEAFFNYLVDILQSETAINTQKWLLSLGLPDAFGTIFPKQGKGIVIGVIDTGADLGLAQIDSPELAFDADVPSGLNFTAESDKLSANDDFGHGTAVSTIAAAAFGNGFNGAGVAPQARILPLKIFALVGGKVKASNEWVSQALMQAFALEVDVINMSLGCLGCSSKAEGDLQRFYEKVLDKLYGDQQSAGGKIPVIVAASGNDGENLLDSPASHPDVIAVGSIGANLRGRSNFSNFAEALDFVAVGEDNLTTIVGGEFGSPGSGTSFAAPQVAGLVALILAEKPGLTVAQVKDLIKNCFTVDVGAPGFDPETGWGRISISPEQVAASACTF